MAEAGLLQQRASHLGCDGPFLSTCQRNIRSVTTARQSPPESGRTTGCRTEGDALQDAQRQLSGGDDRSDGQLPATAGEQVAQIAGIREVKGCPIVMASRS
jgi:hypothetical protein